MHIRSVTAHAFGPLAAESLQLADGMTVVVGDNESAKSSWHAAIYAALCGRRRGKGAPRRDEQRFIELHKPWDRDDWLVSAEVVLDDGRRVELRHDLAGKVDCHAKDLVLGDDISAEVMHEGAPDGARWLGLDRSSFAATACVEQAHMLRVLSDADGLQEHLQRAAATAGTDATAAAALERLDEFKRERVGLDRSNSSKPLRRAIVGEGAATAALRDAQAAHAEYLSRVELVEELRERVFEAQQAVAAHEAAAAAHAAELLGRRQQEAELLDARLGGIQPANVADDDQLAHEVSEALASWRSAPIPAEKPERTAADIEQEIAALRPVPDGDTAVHDSVRRAEERLARADAQLEQHGRNRPAHEVTPAPDVAAGDNELLDLARVVETPVPTVPTELLERERTAQLAAASPSPSKPPVRLLVPAVVVTAFGVAALAMGQVVIGGVVATAGVILGLIAAIRRGPVRVDEGAITLSAAAQAAVSAAREQVAATQLRRDTAVSRCRELGLPPEPAALRAVPVARAREQAHALDVQRWDEQRDSLLGELTAASGELAGALSGRGHTVEVTDVVALRTAVEGYRGACQSRAALSAAAARLPDLVQQRDAARAVERRLDADTRARQAAADKMIAAAALCGVTVAAPEQAETTLVAWMDQRAARLAQLAEDQGDWARLQALLDGHPLESLRALAANAATKATAL